MAFLKEFYRSSDKLTLVFVGLVFAAGITGGLLPTLIPSPSFILAGVAGLVVFIMAIASVQFGLLALIFMTYTRLSDVAVQYHGAPSVAKLFIVLLVFAILIRWIIFKEPPVGWQKPLFFIGLYGMMGFISLLYATDTARVMEALGDFWKDALIAITIVVLLQRGSSFRNVIWTLLITGIFLGTISVVQYLTGTFANDYGGFAQSKVMEIVSGTDDYRISGPIGDPNFYAQIMVVLIPLALERFLHEKKIWLRLLAGWSFAVSALSVVFTFSRGGFLAMFVTIIAILYFYPLKPKYIPVIILVSLGVLSFVPSNYYERLLTIGEVFSASSQGFRTNDMAIRGRASESLTAIEMIKDHPFFGVGVNNYINLYQQYSRKLGFAPEATARAAHNLYLEVMAESGGIGFVIFLALVIAAMQTAYHARQVLLKNHMDDYAGLATAFLVGFIGYMTSSLTVHGAYPRYFYLIVGVAFSLELVVKEILQTEPKQ